MKKQIFKIFATLLILTLSMQMAVSATSTPPKRPIVDTGKQNVSYSIPTYISFKESSVVIPMDEYNRNNPYKVYYYLECDSEGDPLIRIEDRTYSGQIFGMTAEDDRYGSFIGIYPYSSGVGKLVVTSQIDESISDTLIINIVESLDDTSLGREKDVLNPPTKEVDLSGTTNKKPERPIVDTTYDETELEYEIEEEFICEDPFTDVSSNYKYYDAVLALKAAGLINGYNNGTFKPNNTITRAEACTMIVNILENPHIISIKGNTFKDVSNHWAYDSIAKAKNIGLIDGVSEDKFAPDDNITQEQLVKILVALLGYGKNASHLGGYPDGYMTIAYDIGLLKDIDVCVGNQADRGTVAKMIYNALHCYNASEHELVKLSIDNTQTTVVQTKPTNKDSDSEVAVEDDIDDKYNVPDYEDEISEQENAILKAVTSAITYITNSEALLISNFIEECIKKGWTETPVEITSMAESYPEEALLEQLSDVYQKFN